MWIEIFWSVVVLLIIAFVWRFVSRIWTQHQQIEPADEARILAALPKRPILNSGAVALDEPDDELDGDSDDFRDATGRSRQNPNNREDQSALGTGTD
jgi:hypothetical protein